MSEAGPGGVADVGPRTAANFSDEPPAWHGNSGGWDFSDPIPGQWWLDNDAVYTCSK
ncbi:hypothetical protein [Kribbella qitaiheensis]|uniref:hypothetical protein n=1 Tax=Kribbella qitaiheensis TaxID=1544730 RepID=UPI001626BE7F|nr:hypothetical protein [Kribbella qitaiheensis]